MWDFIQFATSVYSGCLLFLLSFYHLELFLMIIVVHRLNSDHQEDSQEDRKPFDPAPFPSFDYDAQTKGD